jgi:hypothetical protein
MRKPVRAMIAMFAASACAMLAATSAQAQMYKWVDENGVTNYSNTGPKDAKTAKKLTVIEDRMSVYAPVPPQGNAGYPDTDPYAYDRISTLQRQLQYERDALRYAAYSRPRTAYDQCMTELRVGCDSLLYSSGNAYAPYGYPIVVAAARRRPLAPSFTAPMGLAGVTAGNVVNTIQFSGGRVNNTPGVTAGRFSSFH